jgi:hypothetical protein
MKPKSIIEKGKRFEKYLAGEIEEAGLGNARREIGSGSGRKKGDIFANIPFLIEAKNQKKIQILNWIDQAKLQAKQGNWSREKWCLVFNDFRKGEFQEVYAVIDFWEFLTLLKKNSAPKIQSPDREAQWATERLVEAAKRVIKIYARE